MAECNITSVQVLNNPAPFTDPIVLDVQYECLSSLQNDLEWRVVYLGAAEDGQEDQVLDSALVGPVQPGNFKFRMEAPAPDPSKIPYENLLGLTGLLLTCDYNGKEFVRVGYYVNIEYTDPELCELVAANTPPNPHRIDKLQRNIAADHPRVTKKPHDFDNAPLPLPDVSQEVEPEGEDLLPEEDEYEDYEEEEEEDEEDGTMGEDTVVDLENVDPSGAHSSAAAAAGMQLQGKPGFEAAAVVGGADDMEL